MKKNEYNPETEIKEQAMKDEEKIKDDAKPQENPTDEESVDLYDVIIDFAGLITRIVIAGALIFCALSLNGISESLFNLSENGIVQSQSGGGSQQNESQPTSTLFELDYAKEHDIMPEDAKATFNLQDKEYFVFFYQTGCGYCVQTEPYIEEYIKAGKTESADIFMVNLAYLESEEQAAKFWDLDGSYTFEENPTADSFKVTGTPTMLHIKDGKADAGIGPDTIASMLNKIK